MTIPVFGGIITNVERRGGVLWKCFPFRREARVAGGHVCTVHGGDVIRHAYLRTFRESDVPFAEGGIVCLLAR